MKSLQSTLSRNFTGWGTSENKSPLTKFLKEWSYYSIYCIKILWSWLLRMGRGTSAKKPPLFFGAYVSFSTTISTIFCKQNFSKVSSRWVISCCRRVAVWYSVVQRGMVCCSVLQCVQCVAVCCSVLQCVAGRCSALQCVAQCCRCRSELQCVAASCSVLQVSQCVAVCIRCDMTQFICCFHMLFSKVSSK